MTQNIKAPFNFVPLNEKVFFPEWAGQVSHDIPFEDGESGTIELELTAMTPVFVRNGHTRADAENKSETYKSFSKDAKGNYFIPATSLKGMIRNVTEIISFGKMSNISNDRYSIRDLQLKKYLGYFQNADIHCGWMRKNDSNTVQITDHGIPRRISHQDLDRKWGTDFSRKFSDASFVRDAENRTALCKIRLSGNHASNTFHFSELPLNPNNDVDNRIKVKFEDNGELKGKIVLTGQPSARKENELFADGRIKRKAQGKKYEFVFPEKANQKFELNIHEEGGIFKDFTFIHKDSTDWKHWRREFEKGKPVPVFFSLKNGELQHFGLSYLYKLPYIKRIKEFLPADHQQERADLPECLFGFSSPNESLKGRVQISHAKLTDGAISSDLKEPYLGSPKPTYYPIYLQQRGKNGWADENFKTMLDDDAKLKGRKRYPVQESTSAFNIPEGMKKENLNPFYPVETGSKFRFKVSFHNLKAAEIGALLMSLIFKDNGYHSIGFAKPFGYGKVKLDILSVSGLKNQSSDFYKESFIHLMTNEIDNYSKSRVLKELSVMSITQETTAPLEYMELKDFVNFKRQNFKKDQPGQYLQYYSDLIVKKQIVKSEDTELYEAMVTVVGRFNQAKLLGGKDTQSKTLVIPESKKVRLKHGNQILVQKRMEGGNIKELLFVKKK